MLAAQATRSVALGVLLTALAQALLAVIGLLVAGVPSVGILAVLMIVTGIAQLGPMPVLHSRRDLALLERTPGGERAPGVVRLSSA